LSERVLALDPNARGLRAAARYARSKELLQATVTRLDQCQATSLSGDGARKALMSQPRRGELDDAADRNLALAEDLWKQEQKVCGAFLNSPGHAPNPNDEAIERVLARLSRQ
jgi:hypothetical protein